MCQPRIVTLLCRAATIAVVVTSAAFSAVPAKATLGLGVGYNNPLGNNLGFDLLFLSRPIAVELGIASFGLAGGDKTASTGLSGDLDIKAILGSKGDFAPYIEGGFLMGAGANAGDSKSSGLTIGFDSPFAGVGLFVEGSTVYAFGGVDYLFHAKKFFPTLSAGIKF